MFAPAVAPSTSTNWLTYLNAIRVAAGVKPVSASGTLSSYAQQAALCLSRNGQEGNPHRLDPALSCGPGVSFSAASIGASGSAITLSRSPRSTRVAIDTLVRAPFHSMAILAPSEWQVGWGHAYNASSPLPRNRSVATLYTGALGLAGRSADATYVSWPAAGWPVAGSFVGSSEWPNPLRPCNVAESGPLMWFANPNAKKAPVFSGLTLTDLAGRSVSKICTYSATGYTNPDDLGAQSAARAHLTAMGATVVVATTKLNDGTYVLSGAVDGARFSRKVVVGASSAAGAAAVGVTAPTQPGLRYQAVAPVPRFDSSVASPARPAALVAAAQTVTVGVDTSAPSASVTITTWGATAPGVLTVGCAAGSTPPIAVPAAVRTITHTVVPLGTKGELCLKPTVATHLRVVVNGLFGAAGLAYAESVPRRLLDSRTASVVGAAPVRVATGAAPGDVVAVQVTAVAPSAATEVSLGDCGELSSPVLAARATTSANAFVPVGADGNICVTASAATHVVVDAVGRFTLAGGGLTLARPHVVADTQWKQWSLYQLGTGGGRANGGELYQMTLAGRSGVPAAATSALLRITAHGAGAAGNMKVEPCFPGTRTSTLAFPAAGAVSTVTLAAVDANRNVCFASSTPVHLKVELLGWVAP